jgi:hypothetical protein
VNEPRGEVETLGQLEDPGRIPRTERHLIVWPKSRRQEPEELFREGELGRVEAKGRIWPPTVREDGPGAHAAGLSKPREKRPAFRSRRR